MVKNLTPCGEPRKGRGYNGPKDPQWRVRDSSHILGTPDQGSDVRKMSLLIWPENQCGLPRSVRNQDFTLEDSLDTLAYSWSQCGLQIKNYLGLWSVFWDHINAHPRPYQIPSLACLVWCCSTVWQRLPLLRRVHIFRGNWTSSDLTQPQIIAEAAIARYYMRTHFYDEKNYVQVGSWYCLQEWTQLSSVTSTPVAPNPVPKKRALSERKSESNTKCISCKTLVISPKRKL